MDLSFERIYERDMDMLLIRKLSSDQHFLNYFFLKPIKLENADVCIESIAHSVSTINGESDVEVILSIHGQRKIALLIEDKINAPAMDNQAERYLQRGNEAVKQGKYDAYYIFIFAPKSYLSEKAGNREAQKYPYKIAYEDVAEYLSDPFDLAVITTALEVSKHGGITVYDKQTTEFWDKLYDFVDENYKDLFRIHGKKGLERSASPSQWITIECNGLMQVQIKCDKGYVDLEIGHYADKFEQFSKDNAKLIDEKQLHVRIASKSLAIRSYLEHTIDFSRPFETQQPALKEAFDAAKELQDLIQLIKIR